jgi:wyosine [tRNA(Phe)-imidazoG37] synthetase (radical SAM superfamily)
LMIDVMILRQFYERREITKMIWIHDINNSVDSMIKTKSSSTLKTMIDINQINLNIIEWVKRATARKTVNQDKKTKQKNEWDEKFQKDESIFFKEIRVLVSRYVATSRVARHDTTPRIASLITWFTLGEHYI